MEEETLEGSGPDSVTYKGYEILPAVRQDPERGKWMPGAFVIVRHAHLTQQIPVVGKAGLEFDNEEETRQYSITMGKEAIDAGLL